MFHFVKKETNTILKVADNGKGFQRFRLQKIGFFRFTTVTNLSYQINGEIELDRTEGTALY
jgi:two-component sensor histidine kinase